MNVPGHYVTIQAAIDAAGDGDIVLVAPGTYVGSIDFHGKSIEVVSKSGADLTIIQATNQSAVYFQSGEPRESTLRGFTIEGGFQQHRGGGILIEDASPTILDNHVVRNRGCIGAGIAIEDGSPLIEGNLIADNTAARCSGAYGPGIAAFNSPQLELRRNVIRNNQGGNNGGGLVLFDAGPALVEDNIITGNEVRRDGGGIWIVNSSDALIRQNIIYGNRALRRGGGIYFLVRGAPQIVNNTIVDNDAPLGASIYTQGTDADISNNLLIESDGQGTVYCGDFNNPSGYPHFLANDVFSQGGQSYSGNCPELSGIDGNISADPLFVDADAGNYHIQMASPAVDAGVILPELALTDIDGQDRLVDGDGDRVALPDIGADEWARGHCRPSDSRSPRRLPSSDSTVTFADWGSTPRASGCSSTGMAHRSAGVNSRDH